MSKVLQSINYVKSQVYKMDTAIDLTYACLIARLPLLLIGNPGTGKSHLSKVFAGMFGVRDKDWFYQSITAKTSPEKLFGGLIAEKMLEGIETYNLSVGAATKTGVIFDELYKSHHPAMMDMLLSFYDENPTIFSGGVNITPDWHWAINTSNFEDLSEDLRYCPLWDRQGVKFIVNNLTHQDSRDALSLIQNLHKKPIPVPSLTVEDIEIARKEAMSFQCSDEVVSKFYDVVLPILEKYAYISQRKIVSFFVGKKGHPSILQSLAYILHAEGDKIVDNSLLAFLPYFCWQDIKKYDELLESVEKVLIPPCTKIYTAMINQWNLFVAEVERGKYADWKSADTQKKKILKSQEKTIGEIDPKQKSDSSIARLRQELLSATHRADEATNKLAMQKVDFTSEEVEF